MNVIKVLGLSFINFSLIVAWILNILQLIYMDHFDIYAAFKIVGILVAPVGSLLGAIGCL